MSFHIISFIKAATRTSVPVADDQPLPVTGGGTAGSPSSGVTTVQSPNSVSETATIASGEVTGLSDAVDCGNARLALIVMPAAWTTADLTFQESADGVTYVDKYDAFGAEYTVVCGGTSRSLTINLVDFIGTRYLKVRSGTTGTPVAQGGARALTLVLQP